MNAVTLDTTLSGENSNSYVDVATCDDYWANHWNVTAASTWTNLTDVQKTSLLVQSCRVIETVRFTNPYNNAGHASKIMYSITTHRLLTIPIYREPIKYLWYQRLQFPRSIDIWFTDEADGTVGQTYIPDPIKWAQCEQTVYTATFDTSSLSNQLQGVSMEKISIGKGNIATTQEYSSVGSMLSPVAKSLIQPYILKNTKIRRA